MCVWLHHLLLLLLSWIIRPDLITVTCPKRPWSINTLLLWFSCWLVNCHHVCVFAAASVEQHWTHISSVEGLCSFFLNNNGCSDELCMVMHFHRRVLITHLYPASTRDNHRLHFTTVKKPFRTPHSEMWFVPIRGSTCFSDMIAWYSSSLIHAVWIHLSTLCDSVFTAPPMILLRKRIWSEKREQDGFDLWNGNVIFLCSQAVF